MNKFEEMNVEEQLKVEGGGIIMPLPYYSWTQKIVGAVAGGLAKAVEAFSGK